MNTAITAMQYCVPCTAALGEFYGSVLGMQEAVIEGGTASAHNAPGFYFTTNPCQLIFRQNQSLSAYVERPNNPYWKIGITVQNLGIAVRHLQAAGVAVSEPQQFRDIGYLAHFKDPNGLIIELLQCGFKGNEREISSGHAIGSQATIAHLSLRVVNLCVAHTYLTKTLGMRLISIQPVDDLEFCLYFYTWSEEQTPVPRLNAVANREWLWSRSYTMIELQHLQADDVSLHHGCENDAAGLESFGYTDLQEKTTITNVISMAELRHTLGWSKQQSR